MSETVKKIFNDISPTYDRLNHLLSFNVDKSWRKKTIAHIQKNKNDPLNVLDVCCGTHDLGLECLKQFPKAHIHALDFSSEMLKVGDQKLARLGVSGSFTTQCGDALKLPYSDNSFDVVMCAYGVRNFDDAQKGMQEMLRVLKPNGQVLVLEFFRPTKPMATFFNKTYAQFVLPCMGRLVSGHTSAYHYLKDSIRGFLSTDEFEGMLKTIGFQNVQTKSFLMGISSCVSAQKKMDL